MTDGKPRDSREGCNKVDCRVRSAKATPLRGEMVCEECRASVARFLAMLGEFRVLP